GIVSDKPAYKLVNYDEDGFWSRLDTFYINYDDDLNILSTVSHKEEFEIKLDGKLYSLKKATHEKYDDPTDSSSSITILDSVYLLCYNLKTHTLTSRNLSKIPVFDDCRMTYLKSKNVFAIISGRKDFSKTSIYHARNLSLTTLDTAGNILKIKDLNKLSSDFGIVEQGNKILINAYLYGNISRLYIIDNVSLDIIDSMNISSASSYRVINDSIVLASGLSEYVTYLNTNAKTMESHKIRKDTCSISFQYSGRFVQQDYFLNLRTLDSIFTCYNISRYIQVSDDKFNSQPLGIKIVNFSHNGDANFSYVFNDFEPNAVKLPRGIACTRDGGIIITVVSSVDNKDMSSYLLKFDPKGNISKVKSLKK
ncbi:MAG: hypothetical protein H6Q15_1298, partial [Bacteroidetes bacterium]|nr:hypothetical protein [Bacteroidota bacterium]